MFQPTAQPIQPTAQPLQPHMHDDRMDFPVLNAAQAQAAAMQKSNAPATRAPVFPSRNSFPKELDSSARHLRKLGWKQSEWDVPFKFSGQRTWTYALQNAEPGTLTLTQVMGEVDAYSQHPAWGRATLTLSRPGKRERSIEMPMALLRPEHIDAALAQAVSALFTENAHTQELEQQAAETERRLANRTPATSFPTLDERLRAALPDAANLSPQAIREITPTLVPVLAALQAAGVRVRAFQAPRSGPSMNDDGVLDATPCPPELIQASVNAGFSACAYTALRAFGPLHLIQQTREAWTRMLLDYASNNLDVSGQRYRVPWTLPDRVSPHIEVHPAWPEIPAEEIADAAMEF